MTPEESEQFFKGADKPGAKTSGERVMFNLIPKTAEERQRHAEKVTAQDAEALGGIRTIIEQAPSGQPTEAETSYGQALAGASKDRVNLSREEAANMHGEATAIVERPQPPKKSFLKKLFG